MEILPFYFLSVIAIVGYIIHYVIYYADYIEKYNRNKTLLNFEYFLAYMNCENIPTLFLVKYKTGENYQIIDVSETKTKLIFNSFRKTIIYNKVFRTVKFLDS